MVVILKTRMTKRPMEESEAEIGGRITAELDLEEDRGTTSPLWALTLLVFGTCREWTAAGARHVLDIGCCCCRRRSRRQKNPPVQVCKDQLDEDDWAPCDAEAVGWMDHNGEFCCLQRKGTCVDRRAADPTPLLLEDGTKVLGYQRCVFSKELDERWNDYW